MSVRPSAWKAFACVALFCMGCTAAAAAVSPSDSLREGARSLIVDLVLLAVVVGSGCALRRVVPLRVGAALRLAVAAVWAISAVGRAPTLVAAILYAATWIGALHALLAVCGSSVLVSRGTAAVCAASVAAPAAGGLVGFAVGPALEGPVQLEGLLLLGLMLPLMAAAGASAWTRLKVVGGDRSAAGLGGPAVAASVPEELGTQGEEGPSGFGPTVSPVRRPVVYTVLDEACVELADAFCLTAREREVLPYLAHGHKPAYCARQLCITESTVRTHMRNIYRKVGVSSGERLIQMAEEWADGMDGALANGVVGGTTA